MKKTKLFAAITAAVISMATITSCGKADIEAIPENGTYRPKMTLLYMWTVPGSARSDKCKLVINDRKGRIYHWALDNIHCLDEIFCEVGEWNIYDKGDWYWRAQIKTYIEDYDAASDSSVLEPVYPKGEGCNFGYGLSSKDGEEIRFVHTNFLHKNSSTSFTPDK